MPLIAGSSKVMARICAFVLVGAMSTLLGRNACSNHNVSKCKQGSHQKYA